MITDTILQAIFAGLEIEIKVKNHCIIRKEHYSHMKFWMTLFNKEDNFKLNYFLEIEDITIECLDRHFELCKNSEVAMFYATSTSYRKCQKKH